VFQLVDVFTTHRLLAHGFKELNPLAGILIAAGGCSPSRHCWPPLHRALDPRPATVGLLCATCVVAAATSPSPSVMQWRWLDERHTRVALATDAAILRWLRPSSRSWRQPAQDRAFP